MSAARGMAARAAAAMFASFAFAYFFSALVRGVTATLAPEFSAELGLTAGDLGLLAGAYFFGFAATQLPMGHALDRHGPRRVLLAMMSLAVIGCVAFALARSFVTLTLARTLIGVGVGACLMAPMTAFRHRLAPAAQLRANSWMLMTGSLGMLASTLPVQWLLPTLGWRGLFWALAALFAVAMVGIRLLVPADAPSSAAAPGGDGYAQVFRHPVFIAFAPLAVFSYGGMIAVQSLWAGPWLVQVAGRTPVEAAQGLFGINLAMLLAFMAWGVIMPRLQSRGWTAARLIARGMPLSLAMLVLACVLGPDAGATVLALFCVAATVVSLSQPALGMAFAAPVAGRALSAYNLLIFAGVFALQWGIGIAVDQFRAAGWSAVSAYRGAFALLLACQSLGYLWFLLRSGRTAAVLPRSAA